MKGVKGTFKTYGAQCVGCKVVLTPNNAQSRAKPRKGLASYCRPCISAMSAERRRLYPEKSRQRQRDYKRRLRMEVLTAMGGACRCCEETTQEFLVIDHINGGGRRGYRLLHSAAGVYLNVKRRGYPPEYQILCHNCNAAKSINGKCPHQH